MVTEVKKPINHQVLFVLNLVKLHATGVQWHWCTTYGTAHERHIQRLFECTLKTWIFIVYQLSPLLISLNNTRKKRMR